MLKENKIWVASDENGDEIFLLPEMANHHGLIVGADNKEVDLTARMIAEGFSGMGISVFITDIHRNLAGMMEPGNCVSPADKKKLSNLRLDESAFPYQGFPVTMWDVYGESGIPLRINISELGSGLMAQLLQLKRKQYSVLKTIYRIADERNLLLVDLNDLKATVNYVMAHAQTFEPEYGVLKSSDLEDILRSIVVLETNSNFLGEVSFNPSDLVRKGQEGKGMVNVLDCNELVQERIYYSTILLWILSEISERLSATYELALPDIVLIIDEARWFFRDDNPDVLAVTEPILNKARNKGIGIWFCAQKIQDIPRRILPYLENRIQLSPNAFSTLQLKEIRAAATHFRRNPAFDTFEVMKSLTTGQAMISLVGEDYHTFPVRKGTILPPQSNSEPVSDSTINTYTRNNSLYPKYSPVYDPESAYEILEHMGLSNLKASAKLSNKKKKTPAGVRNFTIPLGTNEQGVYKYDLADVPHLFVSGFTGTGKTCFVEALITKLMQQNTPDSVQFLIYRFNEAEYAQFKFNPFLIENPTSNLGDIRNGLQAVTDLIDNRLKNTKASGHTVNESHVFIVIDDCSLITKYEWGNESLFRIVRNGRVAKIHLILVTSTPHGTYIPTGIRDGIPSRIAFTTIDHVVSRIIIGKGGAEKLQSPGEMIFKTPGTLVQLKATHYSSDELDEALLKISADYGTGKSPLSDTFASFKHRKNIDSAISESRKHSVSETPFNGHAHVVYSSGKTVHNRPLTTTFNRAFPDHRNDNEKVNIQSSHQEKQLTPQSLLKGSNSRIKVADNKIIIIKKLRDKTFAKLTIDKKSVECLYHHKPSLLFKGHVGIQLKASTSQASIILDDQQTQENLQRIHQAFKKELKKYRFVIEYADAKDSAFHHFIKTLSQDTGAYLFEE